MRTFKRLLVAEVTQDTDAEQHCEANPRETPERRLAQSQFSWPTVKDAEVQRDGDQDEKIEFDPAQRRAHGRNGDARQGVEACASVAFRLVSSMRVAWPGRMVTSASQRSRVSPAAASRFSVLTQ